VKALIVTWQAGGGARIAIGLGRLLSERGHSVRILAPAADAARVTAAGCLHRPFPVEAELAPGRRAEEQRDVLGRLFYGRELAHAMSAEFAEDPSDVVVVDYLLRSAAASAEQLPAADVLLIHTIFGFHGGRSDDDAARRRWYEPVNAGRRALGLDELPLSGDSVTTALVRRAAAAVVALPSEFDDWDEPPANVVYAGPIVEGSYAKGWIRPWPAEDARPLVVVSLGSQFMDQIGVLRRIADALRPLPVHALVTTGEIDPAEIPAGGNVAVERHIPHEAVLPEAALVAAHGGTGTLLAAFAAGLPVLCVPLGRDQPDNARRVRELGLGRVIEADAGAAEIGSTITELLESAEYRERADWMRSVIRSYEGGAPAIRTLEELVEGGGGR
jgi:MGT family glycosyltransferase